MAAKSPRLLCRRGKKLSFLQGVLFKTANLLFSGKMSLPFCKRNHIMCKNSIYCLIVLEGSL